MRDNVRAFANQAAQAFSVPDPVLEIGSRPAEGQEGFADLRSFFAGRRYIGSDFLPGPGVDVLLDTHLLGVRDGQVGSVITMDTLEHVQDPLLALREVHRVLRPDGFVLMSSVMNFPIHNYPWDYWRFTPAAFDLLLRPFQARAVWCQGDPLAPHTVLAAARKMATLDEEIAFQASVAALEATWPNEIPEGPLLRFEPLIDVLVRDRDQLGQEDLTLSALVAGTSVEQTFLCPEDNLTRIDTKYKTHGRMNFCHLRFQLREETTGKVVAEGQYFAAHLVDGVWTPFVFPPIPNSAGRTYRLIVSSWDGREGAAVSPLISDENFSNAEELYEHGERRSGTLCLRALWLAPAYSPTDYRTLAGMADPAAIDALASPGADAGLLRRIAVSQSAHLWQVASRIDNRLDAFEQDMQSLATDVEDILSFVRSLRSSGAYKALRRARGLFRRRTDAN